MSILRWLKKERLFHLAKVTRNFTLQSTPKLKCSEISTLQNRQIKMQLKYSVLQ